MGNKLDSILIRSCNPQQNRQQQATNSSFQDPRLPQQHWQQQQQQHNQPFNQRHSYNPPPQNFRNHPQQLPQYYQQQQQQSYPQQQQPHHHQQQQHKQHKQQKQRKQHRGFFKRSRLSSCPDLLKDNSIDFQSLHFPDNTLRERQSEEKEVEIKIYRSYTDLRAAKKDDVKVTLYRRSRESLAEQHRAHSYSTGVNKFDQKSADTSCFYGNHLSLSNKSILSIATTPTLFDHHRLPSRKSLSRCSNNSNNALNSNKPPLNLDDFPSGEVVRKRTQTFEHFFCNFTVKHFKQLTLLDQLTCLCVAIMPDRANQSLSLLHYLRSTELLLLSAATLSIPDSCPPAAEGFSTAADAQSRLEVDGLKGREKANSSLSENNTIILRNDITEVRYLRNNNFSNINNKNLNNNNQNYENAIYPTLPGYLCHEIDQLKANLSSEHHVIMCQDLTERIITYLSKTVASELSRIFEYQLSLTQENIALRLLAKFACNNIFEAVRTRGRLLDRNSMVTIAMATNVARRSHGDEGMPTPKWISVISFGKELKWNIYDVFKRPALRKETNHTSHPNHNSHSYQMNVSHHSFSHKDFQRSPLASPGLRSHRKQPPLSHSSITLLQPSTPPFTFFSSPDSDPMVYGYRGQVVEFCFLKSTFKFACADDSRYTEELPWRYDDVHRLYSPFFRLLTDVTILEYVDWLKASEVENCEGSSLKSNFEDFEDEDVQNATTATTATLSGLEEWLRRVKSGAHVRQNVSLLYKPFLGSVEVGEDRLKDMQLLLEKLQQQQHRFSTSSEHQMLSDFRPPQPPLPPKQLQQQPLPPADNHQPPQPQQQPQQQQPSNGCQGDEMLRQELAQVTMQCDQLCFNLMDIG